MADHVDPFTPAVLNAPSYQAPSQPVLYTPPQSSPTSAARQRTDSTVSRREFFCDSDSEEGETNLQEVEMAEKVHHMAPRSLLSKLGNEPLSPTAVDVESVNWVQQLSRASHCWCCCVSPGAISREVDVPLPARCRTIHLLWFWFCLSCQPQSQPQPRSYPLLHFLSSLASYEHQTSKHCIPREQLVDVEGTQHCSTTRRLRLSACLAAHVIDLSHDTQSLFTTTLCFLGGSTAVRSNSQTALKLLC